jgi:hypothetical protein
LAALALVLLAGCGRGKDPLEWKIDAPHPRAMQQWLEKNTPLMPEKMARELGICVSG